MNDYKSIGHEAWSNTLHNAHVRRRAIVAHELREADRAKSESIGANVGIALFAVAFVAAYPTAISGIFAVGVAGWLFVKGLDWLDKAMRAMEYSKRGKFGKSLLNVIAGFVVPMAVLALILVGALS